MTIKVFIFKAKNRAWAELVKMTVHTPFYLFIFRSYWHYLFHQKQAFCPTDEMFFGARPNPGAGIGHQMANWIAGLYWCKQLNMRFVHFHFSTKRWDDFLGFGNGEPTVEELKNKGYILRRLPKFEEENQQAIELAKKIMASYQGKKVMFWPPQDHPYFEQYGVMDDLQRRFRNAPARKDDKLMYDISKLNIAIHVRRCVVIEGKQIKETEEIKAMRWLSNNYYEHVLRQVLDHIDTDRKIAVWIFSTSGPEEFADFAKYGEIHFCSDMDEYQSFAHLVFADLLITSKSSFSYKPALMNKGIKICPRNFWHGYPDSKDWILCENNGTFDVDKLKQIDFNRIGQ